MPTLQCPKCKQPIEIKSMPADNRVKCGSCSAEFSLKAPTKPSAQTTSNTAKVSSEKTEKSKSPTATSAKPTPANPTAPKPTSTKTSSTKPAATKPSTKPATVSAGKSSTATAEADDPFAAIDLNSLGKSKRVDLGVAPVQTGAMESPSGGMAPWLPGNAPAYVPVPQAESSAASKGGKAGNEAARITPAAKKSNLGVTIAVIAVLVMMAGGSIVAAIIVASK